MQRNYTVINYNKKLKHHIKVIFYTIKNDAFGVPGIIKRDTYVYNNLYHFLKNENGRIEDSEINAQSEVLENKTGEDILNMFKNMFHQ